jgi:Calx-beta domain-containing protein
MRTISVLLVLLAIGVAATASAQPVVTFETDAVAVSGAFSVALVAESAGAGGRTFIGVMQDLDADGVIRFPVPKVAVMNVIAIDTSTGEFTAASLGTTPSNQSMPAGLIMKGTDGFWSHIVLPDSLTRFIWVRPTRFVKGAVTSSLTDDDATNGNGVKFTQTTVLNSYYSDGSSTTNTGFQNGDLFIALGGTSSKMTGTVNAQLASTSPGVVSLTTSSPISVVEGDSREVTLMRTIGTEGSVSVRARTVPGTAAAGVDYNALNQIVTFNEGEAIKKLTFNTIDDDVYSTPVSLTFQLLDPAGTTIGSASSRAIDIATNDAPPSIAFGNVPASVAEQNAPWTLNVPVTLTGKTRVNATANYAINRDGAATATGSVTIPVGQTTGTIPLNIPGNTTVEPNYTFTILLSPGANATVGNPSTANITITNDDASEPPMLSISATTVIEGNDAAFRVTLSPAQTQEVRVSYATSDVTANAGSDYTATNGILIFAPGETSKVVAVPVTNDSIAEPDERFAMTLTNPLGAGITTARAEITIVDDDAPQLTANDVSVSESAANATLTVRVTPNVNRSAGVTWTTANGTATAGSDYKSASGTLSVNGSADIVIEILQDSESETSETFYVDFTNPTNATLARARVAITILDDDRPATARVSVADTSVIETTGSDTTATFRITLAEPVTTEVRVSYATSDLTATAGSDYAATSGQLFFAPGETLLTVPVTIFGDAISESDERFRLTLSNPTNATLDRVIGVAVIQDNDSGPRPTLTTTNVRVLEGTASNNDAVFRVTLSSAATTEVRVDYATANVNAIAGSDYTAATGTLTFAPGETSKTIVVTTIADKIAEPEERFTLTLTNAIGAVIGTGEAEGTIVDDDVTRFRAVRH